MARTPFSFWLPAVCCLLFAGCATSDNFSPVLVCQLRVPKAVCPNPKTTRIDLATSTGADGHFLWGYKQKEQKEDGQFFIFEPDEFVLHTEPNNRRAVIIGDFPTPQQVFLLPLASKPKVQDWSPWVRPNLLATGAFEWAFMYNKRKYQSFTTNIPSDSFELRYKVELRNLGP